MSVLDANQPQKVNYCIPLWLRDEQIRVNIAKVKDRIQPVTDKRTDPIAIVCYGPSLNDTWEKVRGFKYIMTCSGAHRFLIDRGIIPTWHIDVDPRLHKSKILGDPHPDVEYLMASTCHPEFIDKLLPFNVRLWHVFDANEKIPILPQGEWMITGGCGAGVRCLTLARFLGFTDMHIFGMDGNEGKSGQHASEHPSQGRGFMECPYEGLVYMTSPAFLEAARSTFHELDAMKDVVPTFYGEGLVQAMAKNWKRKESGGDGLIAFNKPETISAEMRELNARLHRDKLEFGVGGSRHADTVKKLVQNLGHSASVLDYGCGKGQLAKSLPFPIWEYDPAIPGKEALPRPADLVVCTDVLEHVEPDKLFFVLDDIKRCLKKVGYFVIHTGPAKKSYADGRNTHLIQKDKAWWETELSKFFAVGKIFEVKPELYVVVGPKHEKAHAAAG